MKTLRGQFHSRDPTVTWFASAIDSANASLRKLSTLARAGYFARDLLCFVEQSSPVSNPETSDLYINTGLSVGSSWIPNLNPKYL